MALELAPGLVIGERYRLDRLLGKGGMGAVWAATHLVTKKPVALKFLRGSAAEDPAYVRRFIREARAASVVRHPNVVGVHDVLTLADGTPAMVMDQLEGETLRARLQRDKPIPLPELASYLVPIVSALGTAHALGIVHRDMKPDNVFLERRTDGKTEPKVLDFGIAKLTALEGDAAQTAGLTNAGTVLGTPHYMAPEQAFADKVVDHRADIWSVGVMMYECLSGKRPVDGESLGQIFRVLMTGAIAPIDVVAPQLPEDVRRLVGRMLELDPAKRLPDLREALDVLSRYSDTPAESFGEAAPVLAEVPTPTSPAGGDDAKITPDAGDVTDPFASTVATTGRLSTTSGSGAARSLRRPAALAAAGAVVLAAAAAALGVGTARHGPEPGASSIAAESTVAPPHDAEPPASATPPPPTSAAAADRDAADSPALDSPEGRQAALDPSGRAARAIGSAARSVAPSARPSTSASTAATPPAPSGTSTATTLPGGIRSAVPF